MDNASNLEGSSGCCGTSGSTDLPSQSTDIAVKDEKGKSRKANKPLMEKRRRERINNCLEQLKSFLMDATKKESSYYSKLEKADILEMTVKYLKNLKRQQMTVPTVSSTDIMDKYIAGFNECTYEVNKYLNSLDGITDDVRGRLIGHLADSLHKSSTLHKPNTQALISRSSTLANPNATQTIQVQGPVLAGNTTTTTKGFCFQQSTMQSPQLQIVPAKLNSGESIYVLVNAQNIPVLGNPVFQSSPVHVPIVQNVVSSTPIQVGDTINNNSNINVAPLTGIRNISSTDSCNNSNNNTIFGNISPNRQNKSVIPYLTSPPGTTNASLSSNNGCDFNKNISTAKQYFPVMSLSPVENQNVNFAPPNQSKHDNTIEITPEKDSSGVSEQNTSASSSDNSSLFDGGSFDGGSFNSSALRSPQQQQSKSHQQQYRNPAWDIPGPSNAVIPSYMDPMWRPW